MLSVIEQSTTLNFEFTGTRELQFVNNSETINFELRDYDQTHPIYRILMDFMELYSYADIFQPSATPENPVIIDIIDMGPQVGDIKKDEDTTPTVVIDII